MKIFELIEIPPQTGLEVSEEISAVFEKSVTPICMEIAFEFTRAELEMNVFP